MASILDWQRAATCSRYHPDNWFGWVAALIARGCHDQALSVLGRWREIDPQNPVIDYYRCSMLGDGAVANVPEAFIVDEFAQFAASFDMVLSRLNYAVPALFRERVASHVMPGAGLDVLDVGCGTGLCGVELRPFARHLFGIDLSAAMLSKARERRIYDQLQAVEICAYLANSDARFDLLVAGDCLIYFGNLLPVAAGIARVLRPGSLALLSFELGGGASYRLAPCGRFQHAPAYVEEVLVAQGLEVVEAVAAEIRQERGEAVIGLIVTARNRS